MTQPELLRGTSVAVGDKALLLVGASGSGKSSLALHIMALGGILVSDDQTLATAGPQGITLSAPPAIRGKIEARGLGILRAMVKEGAFLSAIVDLDTAETERLPRRRTRIVLGQSVPLIYRGATPVFAASLVQFLKAGRES